MATITKTRAAPRITSGSTSAVSQVAVWEALFQLLQVEKRRLIGHWQEMGFTPPQAYALLHIIRGGPQPMNAVAGVLLCDPSTVTGIVDKLEERGLIERRPSADDRRVKLLAATPAGAALHAELEGRMSAPPAYLASLPDSDLDVLSRLLNRTLAAAQALAPDPR